MADGKQRLVIADLSGGRNAVDAPTTLKPNEVVDAVNVDYWQSKFVHKRFGSLSLSTAFQSGGPFTGFLASMYRHVPGTDETLMEEWAVDTALVVGRWTALTGAKFTAPTYKDAPIGNGWDFSFASLTGKLVQAYNPVGAFSAPGAPTIANTGAGTYPAVQRYYRVRWVIISGSTVTARSPEGTASTAFTPSGTGTAARITKPAAPGIGETHWEVEVSLDGTTWKALFGQNGLGSAIAIGTATADDNFAGTTTIETFRASVSWTAPYGIAGNVSYLLAGGGAGGGSGKADDGFGAGGGGGAGEVLTGSDAIAAAAVKAIVIGDGGGGSTTQANGSDGGNTTFNSHTAHGGSGGGWTNAAGSSGTLGGGGGAIGSQAGGTGTKHNGGSGLFVNGGDYAGGGGAGDSAVGGNAAGAAPVTPGAGGAGTASSISGASVTYGVGGSGAYITSGAGANAAANSGNGGDGGGSDAAGGSGGSGVAILSYTLLYAGTSVSNAQIASAARLHLWDPVASSVRRTGLYPGTSAPTVADTGAGAYAAVARIYRIRFTEQQGGITVRRSEPTPNSATFTPSGGGAAARVTRPTAPGEGETHWELEASFDSGATFNTSTIVTAIGTTTYDDSATQANWQSVSVSPALGTYTLQKPYKFICAGENRVIGFGTYDLTAKQHRIEWSAVNGSLNVGDIERVDTTQPYYYDLDEHDSGVPTGIIGPMNGDYYPYKNRQLWQMHPTGDVNKPFTFTQISKTIGVVSSKACSIGEDTNGHPCLYFLSHRGAYQYGVNGLIYIGKGIEDLIVGPTAYLNLSASQVIAHATYHTDKKQWWVWHATNTLPKTAGDAFPTRLSVYHVATGGWTRYTGRIAGAYCSCLLPQQMDATRVTSDLKPAMGDANFTGTQRSCDQPSMGGDDFVAFQGSITTRPIEPGGPGFTGAVGDALLLTPPANGVQISLTTSGDFGRYTNSTPSVVSLTATSEESTATRVSRRFEDSGLSDIEFVSYTIGDAIATPSQWKLDQLVINYERKAPKAA